jgi:hypothetical protein
MQHPRLKHLLTGMAKAFTSAPFAEALAANATQAYSVPL